MTTEKRVVISLTVEQISDIINLLAKLPAKDVFYTITDLKRMSDAQVDAILAERNAAQETPKKTEKPRVRVPATSNKKKSA